MGLFSWLRNRSGTPEEPVQATCTEAEQDGLQFEFEPGWKCGSEQEIPGKYHILEMIREGEDIECWKELLTIETIRSEGPRLSPDDFLRGIQSIREEKAPGVTKWNILHRDSRSILYEWQATPCLGWPHQHEVARALRGTRHLSAALHRESVSDAGRPPLTDDQAVIAGHGALKKTGCRQTRKGKRGHRRWKGKRGHRRYSVREEKGDAAR